LRERWGTGVIFDAIDRSLNMVAAWFSGIPIDLKPNKVIVCILTDGEENASVEYNQKQIFDKISAHTKDGCEFIFLAANQDAI